MATPDDIRALILRMQECFNTRQFDRFDDLAAPNFYSHALHATGVEAGKAAWRELVDRFPGMRVVAEDILVDGDKVAVRSSIEGTGGPDDSRPMLLEIFRVADDRLAEMWGITEGPRVGR
ncbi:ester cyclase [Nocardia araoensis]|uniref:ester cyclase n=1 Tax=Nocardia araoensis TaxID=228600 RepID=UPI000306FF0F|nr:ester cyclase [Nocardia araoensis]